MWQATVLCGRLDNLHGVILREKEDLALADAVVLIPCLMHGLLKIGVKAEGLQKKWGGE